jgi:hypothetical protein
MDGEYMSCDDLETLTGTKASTWRYWAMTGEGPRQLQTRTPPRLETLHRDGMARPTGNRHRVRRRSLHRCTVGECDKPMHARGMCGACYRRWRLYGSPRGGKQVRRQPAECLVSQCHRRPSAHDLCAAHATRWHRTGGDPLPHTPIRKRRTLKQMIQP